MFDWLRKKRRDAPPAGGYVHIEGQETRRLDPAKAADLAARESVHMEEQQTRDLDPVPGAQFKALGQTRRSMWASC